MRAGPTSSLSTGAGRLRNGAAALALGLALPVSADDTRLEEQVVTATRRDSDAAAVPATVTAEGPSALARRVLADDAALFRDQPDLAVARDLRRFGATRINIRGIEDNRVAQFVDGVRLGDFRDGGGPTNFTMSAPLGVAPAFLRRVEVLRGPASSLYGSDAIGGVVGFLTLRPDDLLSDVRARAARYRAAYQGANDALSHSVVGAARIGELSALVGFSDARASEFDNRGVDAGIGAARSHPNPQSVRDRALLGRLEWRPAPGHRLGLIAEARERSADIEVLRLSATLPKVTEMEGEDRSERQRLSVEWEHRPAQAFYDHLLLRLHHQRTRTDNDNVQRRTDTGATCSASRGAGNDCRVVQHFAFGQTLTGASLQLDTTLGGERPQFLSYGLDLGRTRSDTLRDATVFNETAGTVAKSLAGDAFPLRDFPDGQTDTAGLFAQDEIHLRDGTLVVTPGLRFDWRHLEPRLDALSRAVLEANGKQAVSQTDHAFSPKLAALLHLDGVWSVFGQVVRGFRAPNYEEVNGAFRNSVQRYGISPNPDLSPETSTGVELGLRLNTRTARAQVAIYDNHYRNFIEQVRLACPEDPACIADLSATFMARNVSRVRIYGAELRGQWDVVPAWQIAGAVAWAHGTNEDSGQPLDSVEPARLSLTLRHETVRWGAQGQVLAATRKDRVDDDPDDPWFRPPGYAVVHLATWWSPTPEARLQLGIDNLFDQTYWLWSDIRQADARSPAGVAFYSQPGRSLSFSFSYRF
ncbi:MAG: TonB-dependent hemoglobin/transferrin/lactoferrin family receptor [Rhodocyclaceae bacterium]|nr:TonB-dependent hemoglobin/transferrin/lactoferrin family receptor [Rhodocyclaceae bacterium]